jgi:hypothetical protein
MIWLTILFVGIYKLAAIVAKHTTNSLLKVAIKRQAKYYY